MPIFGDVVDPHFVAAVDDMLRDPSTDAAIAACHQDLHGVRVPLVFFAWSDFGKFLGKLPDFLRECQCSAGSVTVPTPDPSAFP
jgi:hypothetical protein